MSADDLPEAFVHAMNDDFNIPGALAAIFSTLRQGNIAISEDRIDDVEASTNAVRSMLDVLGLDPLSSTWNSSASSSNTHQDNTMNSILDKLINAQLDARAQARASKDFAQADAIRDALSDAGITIEDGPQGSTWKVARS